MAALNGDSLSPIPPDISASVVSTAKRKHDQISTDATLDSQKPANDQPPSLDEQASIRAIWQALNARDYPKPLLSRISSFHPSSKSQSEHIDKRPKSSSGSKDQSIASKVKQGQYQSLDAFVCDIEASCSDLFKANQAATLPINSNDHNISPSEVVKQQHLTTNASSFTKLAKSLAARERQYRKPTSSPASPVPQQDQAEEPKLNGTTTNDHTLSIDPLLAQEDAGRTVLTIYGNAQGPRQLFSSLQRPLHKSKPTDSNFDGKPDTVAPLRENGLPPGISSTKILPTPKDDPIKSNQKQRLTLQDVFATPTSIPTLAPPKTPKSSAPRTSAITWTHSNPSEQRRLWGHTSEKFATGAWLGYNGVAPAEEPATPQAKRKQRDRALSIGEASFNPHQATKAAQLRAEEEALFRSAYSSFAPSLDNSTALIPERTRASLWWHRYGNQLFQQAFTIQSAPESSTESEGQVQAQVDEETRYRQAVEQFVPATFPEPVDQSEDREAEEILEQISHMLETLHSYQRIRMSTLPSTGPRSNMVQNSPIQDLNGDPKTPSVVEMETYKTLKAQLALLVSMLPPYAVSKLNGDQLAELHISQDIPIEVEDYRGVMEEDKASRDAKQAAFHAAVGAAAASNRQTPIQPANQARPHPMPQSARPLPPQNQQFAQSTPKTTPRAQPQFSRQPLSSWQNPNGNNQANTQRPAYVNPQHFSQQTPRNLNPPLRPGYPQMPQPGRPGSSHQTSGGSYQASGQTNYQQGQRPQHFGSPSGLNMPNGNYAGPHGSSPRMMAQQQSQRNFSSPMQYQSQNLHMQIPQQSSSHQGSQSQSQYNLGQSPQQQYRPEAQTIPNKPPPNIQANSQQPPHGAAPASSPMHRPSSSGGLGGATANSITDTAIESRSDTPATPAAVSTPATTQTSGPPPQASTFTLNPGSVPPEPLKEQSPDRTEAETKMDVEPQPTEPTATQSKDESQTLP